VFNLLKSILTTAVVSTVVTILCAPFTKHYIVIFSLATVTQFVLFYIIGSVMDYIGEIKLKELNVKQLEEYSKQGLEVQCPCYKKVKEFVPIILNAKNTYKCSDCGKTNSVIIATETAHTLDPIA
jgi:hypothetical protein